MQNKKIFLISLLLSLPFWWGVNFLEKELEESFFLKIIAENPDILTASLSEEEIKNGLRGLRPARNHQAEELNLKAKSVLSVFIDNDRKKILFEKSANEKLPIASLTKLMTSYVVLENYDLEQMIEISELAVKTTGEAGNFRIGERFFVKNLLYPLLIESSNDAATALVEIIGENAFMSLMNLEARHLGLLNTHFVNATGLDPETESPNYSTCEDLVTLSWRILTEHPMIFDILSVKELDFYSPNGFFHHYLVNKNDLLGKIPMIIGGKTGYTPKANGCLVLVTGTKNGGFLINIILGSENRFEEMERLLSWVNQSYKF